MIEPDAVEVYLTPEEAMAIVAVVKVVLLEKTYNVKTSADLSSAVNKIGESLMDVLDKLANPN